jgi:HK97 family phage prohead protease
VGFLAWLTSADRPQTAFAGGDGEPYMPVATYITEAMSKYGSGSVSRKDALAVMAVLKGRNMIANIATLPLRQIDKNRKTVEDTLFTQFDPQVPNVVHLAQTVEDLLFDGIAWWKVTRRDALGWPKDVQHIAPDRVSLTPPTGWGGRKLPSGIDPESAIWVDGKPQSGRDYIRFDSPNPPLLAVASRAIRRAILLEELAAMYADNPGLSDYFTPKNALNVMSEEDVRKTLQAWVSARKKRRTGYVPESLEYKTVQSPNPVDLQLVQLQAKASLDIANALGVDPEDLGISTTSRTYQNATDRRQDRVNDVLSGFMKAITDRLNMGDITRKGYRVVFDLDDYMRADPRTRWETHKTALELGATDVAEIREREDWVVRPDLDARPDDEEAGTDQGAPSANQMKGSLMRDGVPATFSAEAPAIDAAQTFRFEGDAITFAADTEKRTITGTAILYGVAADNGWGTFTFAKGSLEWNTGAVSRVKFLRDHDWGQLLGSAASIKDEGDKVTASFKVARGAAGDEALTLAEDGALDGLSVGVDIIEWTEDKDGNFTVNKAILNEVSLTPRPAFEDARLTKVAASKNQKNENEKEFNMVDENKTPDAPAVEDLDARIAAAVAAALSKHDEAKAAEPAPAAAAPATEAPAAEATPAETTEAAEASFSKTGQEAPMQVNPVRETPAARFEVQEKLPYTFDRAGNFTKGEHEFSTDLVEMLKSQDFEGKRTEAGKRVMGMVSQAFVSSGDVNELNPAINRPQDYYEPRAQRTPLWDLINKGDLPNGVQPFTMPKFASAGNLVNDHTEGVEPVKGTFVTTSQTITPTAVSGKVNITREVWDMGGNPATSTLIWARMVREYRKGLESAAATFLNGLAATTVALPAADVEDSEIAKAVQAILVGLTFEDSYEFEAFALEQNLYTRLANATDAEGRALFPAIGAQNANGTVANLFQSINVNGTRGVPAPSLPHTPGSVNASLLFDPEVVAGYASAPQRLEFAGSSSVGSADDHPYAPVAGIDVAIWGYKAFANVDLGGVRKVTYDSDSVTPEA